MNRGLQHSQVVKISETLHCIVRTGQGKLIQNPSTEVAGKEDKGKTSQDYTRQLYAYSTPTLTLPQQHLSCRYTFRPLSYTPLDNLHKTLELRHRVECTVHSRMNQHTFPGTARAGRADNAQNHIQTTLNRIQITLNHIQTTLNHIQTTLNHIQTTLNHIQTTLNKLRNTATYTHAHNEGMSVHGDKDIHVTIRH